MLKTLSTLLLASIAVLCATLWLNRAPIPCEEPLTYSLGSFDSRFGISREAFLSAVSEAEALWEKAIGKELFTHVEEEGRLAVNLIYDYRQEVTEELSEIESVVKTGEASYDALHDRYQALKSEYVSDKRSYDAAVSAFNQHSAAYEASVERWNKGKRASKAEFEALETERRALESELSTVRMLESEFNTTVRELNATVGELNTLARKLNLNVEQYNDIGASRGDTFAGGIYTSDAEGERIDIFEFENTDKLLRTLAHELGHALGLEHIEDPKAIMYYLNEGEAGRLTASDIEALKLLCGVQ